MPTLQEQTEQKAREDRARMYSQHKLTEQGFIIATTEGRKRIMSSQIRPGDCAEFNLKLSRERMLIIARNLRVTIDEGMLSVTEQRKLEEAIKVLRRM